MAGPGVAQAHLVTSGLGLFYDGALHVLLSPGDLLGVLPLALLAGLRGATGGRLAVVAMRGEWGHVMLRVMKSWVAAVGLLMLGWTLQSAA
jgi:hypothetical protein